MVLYNLLYKPRAKSMGEGVIIRRSDQGSAFWGLER